MKWWAIVRVRSVEKMGIKPGEYVVLIGRGPIKVMRDVVANDVQSHKSVEAGNIWVKERVGKEWDKGNWKWDPRWK
jgi:hypothetical protein